MTPAPEVTRTYADMSKQIIQAGTFCYVSNNAQDNWKIRGVLLRKAKLESTGSALAVVHSMDTYTFFGMDGYWRIIKGTHSDTSSPLPRLTLRDEKGEVVLSAATCESMIHNNFPHRQSVDDQIAWCSNAAKALVGVWDMDPADFEFMPPKWGGGLTRPKAINGNMNTSQTPDMSAFLIMFGTFKETFVPQGARRGLNTVQTRGILYAKPGNLSDKSGEYIWRDFSRKGAIYRVCGQRCPFQPSPSSIGMRLPDNTFIRAPSKTSLGSHLQGTELDKIHEKLLQNAEYAKSFNAWDIQVPLKTPSPGPGQGGPSK